MPHAYSPTANRHYERSGLVAAAPELLFAYLDDAARLGAHMTSSTMTMGGGRMAFDMDSAGGMAVGSHIRMNGSAFGLHLSLEEEVVEHDPPRRKTWRTIGQPRMILISDYVMGFCLDPAEQGSILTVWIDYRLPERGIGHVLGVLFAGFYARWCVRRMVSDASRAFAEDQVRRPDGTPGAGDPQRIMD